ncbi:hypothetical protein HG531_012753 [Fusarium graminearum]|nr:hypothetical protein HG531_012753 [Fusarium graminearum]
MVLDDTDSKVWVGWGSEQSLFIPRRVGVQYRHELVFAEIRKQRSSPNNAGIGKEDIQSTVALHRVVNYLLDLILIRRVETSRVNFHTWKRGVDLFLVRLKMSIVKVAEIQSSRATFRVLMGSGTADTQCSLSLLLAVLLLLFIVLSVVLQLHILETKFLLFLICTGIALTVNTGVRSGGVHEGLDVAAREGVGELDCERLVASDSSIETIEESGPLVLLVVGERVTTLAGATSLEDLGVKIATDLSEETLDSGETTAKCTGVDLQLKLGALQSTSLALENVTGQIGAVLDLEGDLLTLLGNLTTSLDIVGSVATVLANSRHKDDLLKVRNVDHLHVGGARTHATRTCSREAVYLVRDDITLCGQTGVLRLMIIGVCVRDTKRSVLLIGSGILVLLPLANTVLQIRSNE